MKKKPHIEATAGCIAVIRMPGNKQRGVCATKQISSGELIERAPIMRVPGTQKKFIEKTVLWDHWFTWGDDDQDLAIALGFGALYNHSYQPNAMCYRCEDKNVLEYVALRNIEAGEEITINYHGEPDCTSPVWFEYEP